MMRSDNLRRHQQLSRCKRRSTPPAVDAGVNSSSIHVGHGSGQQPRDPWISSLINRLVNSTAADEKVDGMKIREMKIAPKRKNSPVENPMPAPKKPKFLPYSKDSEDDDMDSDESDVGIDDLPPPPTQIGNVAEDTDDSEDDMELENEGEKED